MVEGGGYAFGAISSGTELAADTESTFTLQARPANETGASWRDLTVADANATGDLVIAILQNDHEAGVGGVTIEANEACFDPRGDLLDIGFGLLEASADLQTEACPRCLFAGHGDFGP